MKTLARNQNLFFGKIVCIQYHIYSPVQSISISLLWSGGHTIWVAYLAFSVSRSCFKCVNQHLVLVPHFKKYSFSIYVVLVYGLFRKLIQHLALVPKLKKNIFNMKYVPHFKKYFLFGMSFQYGLFRKLMQYLVLLLIAR